jgi:hypothetical protein
MKNMEFPMRIEGGETFCRASDAGPPEKRWFEFNQNIVYVNFARNDPEWRALAP